MNWKKRKRLRKIAHAHGKSHYYEWNHTIRALCQLNRYMTYIKEGGISPRQLVDELNKLYTLMGIPEYCITWDQMIQKVEEYQDRMILQFLDEYYSTPSIEVTKPASFVVEHKFGKGGYANGQQPTRYTSNHHRYPSQVRLGNRYRTCRRTEFRGKTSRD